MAARNLPVRARFLSPEELVCATIFLFFSVQGAIPGIAPPQAYELNAAAPSGISTAGGIASQLLVNGAILLLILRRPRLVLRQIAAVPWLALFALLAVASAAWSLDPLLTLRRAVPFALAGLFGLYFAARFSGERQVAMLRATMLAAALATVALVLLEPSLGLDHSAGHATAWQGIFTQKNACGRIMVLATAVLLFADRITPFRLACLALYFFILVRSGSRGAWIVEIAILLFWIFFVLARRAAPRLRTILAVAGPLCALAMAGAAMAFYPRLAPLLGRDATLSGRTAIWQQVFHFIEIRPWFGYGCDAFWRGMAGPSLQISAAVHFVVVHAHNGFLEIVLELGVAGLVLFLLGWMSAALQLAAAWRRGEVERLAWAAAVLLLIVLYDLDENTLLIHNGLFWTLYISAAATAARLARDCRHTAAEPAHAILKARSQRTTLPSSIPQETV